MLFSLFSVLALGALVGAAPAQKVDKRYLVERDGTTYNVFEHAATGAKLEFVTNSGVCETTAGVNTYSGYLSVGNNMNMSRKNPTTAPLAMWLNGGPGCSSMIGLFQENGPCRFASGASTPSNNTYSWNNVANMLYVDQPIGTGFSYGTNNVDSTVSAAPYVWTLLQAFYAQYPQYKNRNFGLFTESYGGHYGPEFASYFQSQNQKVASGSVSGTKIPLVALGINNGWYDPILQYKAYITYSANNSYNQIISPSQAASYTSTYNNRCVPALKQCPGLTGTNQACASADNTCYSAIEGPISQAKDFDVYDVRAASNDPNPPATYATYINAASIRSKIGAKASYVECSNPGYSKFASTGDGARSLLATMSAVVASGIQVVMWAGDADWICNYQGNFVVANALQWSGASTFANKALSSYTVAGKQAGLFKTVSNLSWLQVYAAGHEVPFYQPAAALQVFQQTMSGKALTGT